MRTIKIIDISLSYGSQDLKQPLTIYQVRDIAKGLDIAGVNYFEVGHGGGLDGSLRYERSVLEELKLIEVAAETCQHSKVSVLFNPGTDKKEYLLDASKAGAKLARIVFDTKNGEATARHIAIAREQGLKTAGYLIISQIHELDLIITKAKLLERFGTEIVYISDSKGTMLPNQVNECITALKGSLSCEIGFVGQNQFSRAMSNSFTAIQAGASYVDGSLRPLGAVGGNVQTDLLTAVLERLNYDTGIDLSTIVDVANEVATTLMERPFLENPLA